MDVRTAATVGVLAVGSGMALGAVATNRDGATGSPGGMVGGGYRGGGRYRKDPSAVLPTSKDVVRHRLAQQAERADRTIALGLVGGGFGAALAGAPNPGVRVIGIAAAVIGASTIGSGLGVHLALRSVDVDAFDLPEHTPPGAPAYVRITWNDEGIQTRQELDLRQRPLRTEPAIAGPFGAARLPTPAALPLPPVQPRAIGG